MEWKQLSKKQLQVLSWWTEKSPYSNYNGIICEGAVRSGKTIVMSSSFCIWAMNTSKNKKYAICGKTVGALRRNIITDLKEVLNARGYKVLDRKNENAITVSKGKVSNTFYLFGGRDERSQDLIQGITLRGILLDEVALMPRSFVEQAMARCSEEGSKFWFNCNPEGPQHWFYVEHILKAKEMKYLRIHFNIEDNLSLSPEIIARYKSMFTGVFYKRFILGEWVAADGIIYDCFDSDKNCYSNKTRNEIVPIEIIENDPINGKAWISSDYGVYNPMVFLKGYKFRKSNDPVPYFYIDDEYYYESRKKMVQRTDSEYVEDLIRFIGNTKIRGMIIDPSASSLIVAAMKSGISTIKANNDVLEGIRMVYVLLATGHILINKDNCPNLINELGLYVWNEKRSENGKEEPVKQFDHALDALRYLVRSTTSEYEVFINT